MLTFDAARRGSEILLGLAMVQPMLEHAVTVPRDRTLAVVSVALVAPMLAGFAQVPAEASLLLSNVRLLQQFQGPYNGGSDRIRLLLLTGLLVSYLLPGRWAPLALGYVAVQVVLSYTLAGWVKLLNPEWRNGQALVDVFSFSVYPVSESLRHWARRPRLLRGLAWLTIAFEVLFPLSLLHPTALPVALAAAFGFHVVNACVFGLNRFVWSWLATYPCLLWFQSLVR